MLKVVVQNDGDFEDVIPVYLCCPLRAFMASTRIVLFNVCSNDMRAAVVFYGTITRAMFLAKFAKMCCLS
jgi:hypothetical protein